MLSLKYESLYGYEDEHDYAKSALYRGIEKHPVLLFLMKDDSKTILDEEKIRNFIKSMISDLSRSINRRRPLRRNYHASIRILSFLIEDINPKFFSAIHDCDYLCIDIKLELIKEYSWIADPALAVDFTQYSDYVFYLEALNKLLITLPKVVGQLNKMINN